MKKILTAILGLVALSYAAAPTAPTMYNNTDANAVYSANIYNVGNPQIAGAARDSLKGADTIVLLNKYPIDNRWQYIAQTWDSGGVADTVKYEIQYYTIDGKFKGASTLIDSAAGNAPAAGISRLKAIDLAINQTSFPGYITLIAKKPVATLVTKIRRFELIQRRARVSASLSGGL